MPILNETLSGKIPDLVILASTSAVLNKDINSNTGFAVEKPAY